MNSEISEEEFVESIGNPQTEEEAQVSVGMWLAEQIGHTPVEIRYMCLGHHNNVSYCAYSDSGKLLGMTFANLDTKEVLVAPADKSQSDSQRINNAIEMMRVMAGKENYEEAAMCRNLATMLGVEFPLPTP